MGNTLVGPTFVGNSQVTDGLIISLEYTGTPVIEFLGDGSVIYTFNGSGSIQPVANQPYFNNISVELLLVAGGGGGGDGVSYGICPSFVPGGGGGAGEYYYNTSQILTVGETYNITVGAGGQGGTANTDPLAAKSGGNSTFGTLTAIGGGRGASGWSNEWPAEDGGSGGGGAGNKQTLTPGNYVGADSIATIGLGNDGADGSDFMTCSGGSVYAKKGGGGGGSGSPGSIDIGGAGTSNSITGTAVTYAAGGNSTLAPESVNPGDGGRQETAGQDGIVVIKVSTL